MKFKYLVIGFILGALLCFLFLEYNLSEKVILAKTENHKGQDFLVNPLLECVGLEASEHIDELNISKFEISDYTDKIKKKNNDIFISVYVRDLNNGPWIGINEKEDFIGASLLKVPLLMSYLKISEREVGLLDKKLLFTSDLSNFNQFGFESKNRIEKGKEYTVRDLLEYSIYYSDNNAAEFLAKYLSENEINDVFYSIGFGSPTHSQGFPVNTKTYAGFFRVLFNASYLSKENSNMALNILTKTDFNNGLVEQLPKDLVVAHKFGVREDNDYRQLHDCGIVYYPNNPYLICIMTKTKTQSFDVLAKVISDISKLVYDQVSTKRR